MLSIGIQFGHGFDRNTVRNMSQEVPKEFEYDLIVIGSDPGGVACAMEAGLAGKKTALIKCMNYSPAEKEGVDEDLEEMEEVLKGDDWFTDKTSTQNSASTLPMTPSSGSGSTRKGSTRKGSTRKGSDRRGNKGFDSRLSSRKVRRSRLDMNNEFFKRGEQCRKLMHNAVLLGELVDNAYNSGWRLTTTRPPLTMNWTKMSEEILDFVMEENFKLATQLSDQSVEVMEGEVSFEDLHTVKLTQSDMTYTKYTTELICLAPLSECILPEEVTGAQEFGITSDDFLRLAEAPKSTLIVGGLPESLECAGIVAGARFPVTVASRSKILKDYDSEITEMILHNLSEKGVKFLEGTTVKSIRETSTKALQVTFEFLTTPEEESAKQNTESKPEEPKLETKLIKQTFDTVVFAVGRKVRLNNIDLTTLGLELNVSTGKVMMSLPHAETGVENIYAVGGLLADCPEGTEISYLAGRLLGRRLFHDEVQLMDYGLIPCAMYTPVEYGFVGLSEDVALLRLGEHCIQIYYGYFKPLECVVPPKPETQCFAKIITLQANELIVGMHFYGPQAGEVIQGFAAAVRTGMCMNDFRTLVGLAGTNAQGILKLKEFKLDKKLKDEEEGDELN